MHAPRLTRSPPLWRKREQVFCRGCLCTDSINVRISPPDTFQPKVSLPNRSCQRQNIVQDSFSGNLEGLGAQELFGSSRGRYIA